MNYLYLDIETLPTKDPFVIAEIDNSLSPPASMTKAETIEKWKVETRPTALEEAIAKTALTGAFGSICVVGWTWDDAEPQSANAVHGEISLLDEAIRAINATAPNYGAVSVVGHNVANFDIRFLWQRCFVLGIRAPAWLPRDPKPWSREVQDTMAMWSGARDFISLDKLCRALGLPGKGDMDGADVAAAWARGEYDKVSAYCRADVERVRAVHRKMLVATGE